MELIIIIIAVTAIFIVNSMMRMNSKELEKIAIDEELNKITKKYPTNKEICQYILKMLGNKSTKIEEDTNSEITLYIAIKDKISIGNTHESFTRIQTMIHECLHSIQDKKMLNFNFYFSNIFLIFFIVICILVILKKLPNELFFSNILLIFSFIYYTIRSFLENDAMIRAEYLAKDYVKELGISTKQEISQVCKGFEELNKGIIKGTNCSIFIKIMIKVVIFNVLALIF